MNKHFYKKFKYKQFLRIREPLHENSRILNFKRPKWTFLKKIFFSKYLKNNTNKKFKYKRLKFNYFYPTGYIIPNRWVNLRFNYRENLLSKTKLEFFYGLTNLKKKKHLLVSLESRLDIILWRANFFKSPAIARFYITHKNIYINSKIVNIYQKILIKGDIVTFSSLLKNKIKKDYLKSKIEQKKINNKIFMLKKKLNNIFPFYIETNGDILALIYFNKIDNNALSNLVYLYPTSLNIEKTIKYLN